MGSHTHNFFFLQNSHSAGTSLLADRSRCLQPQIESNGIVSLLGQLWEEKVVGVRALDGEREGKNLRLILDAYFILILLTCSQSFSIF